MSDGLHDAMGICLQAYCIFNWIVLIRFMHVVASDGHHYASVYVYATD